MKILKYIIDEKNSPIIFSTEIIHNTVVQKANSAGFIIIEYNQILNKFSAMCYGKSTSLNVKSKNGDRLIIEKYLNNHFFQGLNIKDNFSSINKFIISDVSI